MSNVRLKATRIAVQLAVASSPSAASAQNSDPVTAAVAAAPQSTMAESKMIVLPLIVMAISVFVGSSIGPVRIRFTFERAAD
jgi:hypothetical protein